MMRWWLDRGVDGFRMDVINLVSKAVGPDGSLPDGVPRAAWLLGSEHYVCGPRVHEFLQEMHREVFDGRPGASLTVGETPAVTLEQARLYTDPTRREVDMVFQFEHMFLDRGASKWDVRSLDLRALKENFRRWQAGLADVGWNSLYWDNHDQPRAVSRFGSDAPEHRVASAKLLATVLHLHHGTPYVYQGEELGMTNTAFAGLDDFRDIESINHARHASAGGTPTAELLAGLRAMSRDNARTPMHWDASQHAGFTTGTPWIAVNPNHVEINAADQWADPGSVLHHYRALIRLRHTEPAVVHGDFTLLLPDDPAIWAFTRRHGRVELLVLANLSTDEVAADIPAAWDRAELLLGNLPDAPAAPTATLRPWEARILRRPT
jgi:oligo-1,6-glucosidase